MPQLTEEEIMVDLYTTAKHLAGGYHAACIEAGNDDMRQNFATLHGECVDQIRKMFDAMNVRGWYKVNQASPPQTRY